MGSYFYNTTENSIIFDTSALLSNLVDTGQWVQKLFDKTFRQSHTDQTKENNIISIKQQAKNIFTIIFYLFMFSFMHREICDTGILYYKEILRNKSDCCLRLKNFRGKNNNTRFPSS